MTTAAKRVAGSAQPRQVLRNRLSNMSSPSPSRRMSKFSEMSPEARRAMVLTREETKENLSSSPHSINANLSSEADHKRGDRRCDQTSRTTNTDVSKTSVVPRSPSKSRIPPRPQRAGTTLTSQRSTMPQATARSRSTLSHQDTVTRSVSDRSGYAKDAQNNNVTMKHYRSHVTSTNSNNNNSSISNLENNNEYEDDDEVVTRSRGDGIDDDLDAMELNGNEASDCVDASSAAQRVSGAKSSQSFVLTLDKVLEARGVSRLRGDITDTAAISEPGTVRALNGGRLTNAQEVVVNVCHEDERELVFHDDDEESLDTAKTVSNIRINIWMEYNNNFRPDNATDEMEIGVPDTVVDDDVPARVTSKPPSHNRNVKNGNNKNFLQPQKETVSRQRNRVPRVANISTGHASSNQHNSNGSGNNNGSRLTARPKSVSPAAARDGSTGRVGSGLSTESSRRSSGGSASSRQRETFLRRKAKS